MSEITRSKDKKQLVPITISKFHGTKRSAPTGPRVECEWKVGDAVSVRSFALYDTYVT